MLAIVEETPPACDLSQQVSLDLEGALAQFKDLRVGLRILSQKMDIHERTLRRLLQREHVPNYLTLYKIYRVLTSANDDTTLLKNVPELIREHIVKMNPKLPNAEVQLNGNLERELLKDRVMGEIYFLAACSAVRRDEIVFRYGQFGMEALRRLLSLGALKESSPQLYVLGSNQANFSAAGIKTLGLNMVETFASSKDTDLPMTNFMGVFAEGISEETYKEWIRIDKEAYYKKVELTKMPGALGSIRGLTFMVTDKMKINNEVL